MPLDIRCAWILWITFYKQGKKWVGWVTEKERLYVAPWMVSASRRLALIAWQIGVFGHVISRSISFKMHWNVSLVTRKFSYHCCSSNAVSAMSNQAWLLGLTHRPLSRKFWQATCTVTANYHFSFRLIFSYFAKMSINFLVAQKMVLPVSI